MSGSVIQIASQICLIVAALVCVGWAKVGIIPTTQIKCPEEYLRFSANHTYCINKPNPMCHILKRGLNVKTRALILHEHNWYRNVMSNFMNVKRMIAMEWDEELANLAQKWAEFCPRQHDCQECRQVESQLVGQNIGHEDVWCSTKNCPELEIDNRDYDNYVIARIVEGFYREIGLNLVEDNLKLLRSGVTNFTEVIWGSSWRLGCGYVIHWKDKFLRRLIVCNYGPSGNGLSVFNPVRETKKDVCEFCPLNSCCGPRCSVPFPYTGLCKIDKGYNHPIYDCYVKGLSFYCDFEPKKDGSNNKMCEFKAYGKGVWTKQDYTNGYTLSIRMNGGVKGNYAALIFSELIRARAPTCIRLNFRKGPQLQGKQDKSVVTLLLIKDPTFYTKTEHEIKIPVSSNEFLTYSVDVMSHTGYLQMGIGFKVAPNENTRILDISHIQVYHGLCRTQVTDWERGCP